MTIKLTHPQTGATTETTESYEEMYRSQGWVTPAEAKKAETADKAEAKK